MSEFIVIYDAAKEIAAIVDVENRVGYGPAMIGKDAETLLEGFLITLPYDIITVGSYQLRKWFEEYMRGIGATDTPPSTSPTEGEVDTSGSGSVAESRQAVSEAVAESAAPPAEQPADTDMEGNQGEAPAVADTNTADAPQAPPQPPPPPEYKGPCWNCAGTGSVQVGDTQGTCNVCKGTGQLPAPDA